MSIPQLSPFPAPAPARRRGRLALGTAACIAACIAATAAGAAPAIDLDFGDIHARPVGPRGLQLSERLRRADGQRVRLHGHVVDQQDPAPDRFYFSARPLTMSEHADGEADDLPPATVVVLLPAAGAPRPAPGQRIGLEGMLQVGRVEHADGRVSWVRLQLPPSAAEPRPSGVFSSAPSR